MKRAKDTAIVLYNRIEEWASPDEKDVLQQLHVVSDALAELGYEPVPLEFSLAIDKVCAAISKRKPLFVFNLTEAAAGDEQLIHLAPAVLDHLRLPYTGCGKEAIFLTSNKILAKEVLRSAGIETPDWIMRQAVPVRGNNCQGQFIVKSIWTHGSNWWGEDAIIDVSEVEQARAILARKESRFGKTFFAERFIDGREFNLSILDGQVLDIPEMRFVDYPQEKMRVVDYQAKWNSDSFEYHHTVRSFDFAEGDAQLLDRLRAIARRCWDVFEMSGYARVDFRVDGTGLPWVLEINANPCISFDSGFVAAAKHSGISFPEMIKLVVQSCLAAE